MFKKMLIGGVIVTAIIAAVNAGTIAVGVYNATHSEKKVSNFSELRRTLRGEDDAKQSVEKSIAALRKEVAALDKDIDKVKDDLAKEIVEVRELTGKTADLRAAVDTEQKTLLARGEAIKDATERVKYGTSTIPVPEAKDRLKRDVASHLKRKQNLENTEKILTTREKNKETLEKQLDAMIRQKAELRNEIDAVESEYKTLQLQQIEAKYQTDDSRLAKIKDSIRDMRKKLDIEKEKLNLTPAVEEEKPVSSPAQSVDEILSPISSK